MLLLVLLVPAALLGSVFVNGEFLGGCDAIQKLQSSGVLASKLFQAAADHSMAYVRKAPAAAGTSGGAHGGSKKHAAAAASGAKGKHSGVEQPYSPDEHFVDPSAQPALGDATSPAYPCLGAFPEVVDSNAIRLTAIQVGPGGCCVLRWLCCAALAVGQQSVGHRQQHGGHHDDARLLPVGGAPCSRHP